jgi:hypothetical protein
MTVYIYGLFCPLDERIRYIGKSINPEKRAIAHVSGANTNAYSHHTARWIRKLSLLGRAPMLVVLDEIPCSTDWREREREWIVAALHMDWPLTNSTAGGEGLDYLDPVDRAQWRKNHAAAMRRHWDSDAGLAHMRKLRLGLTAEVVKKRTASVRKALKKPEYRDKMQKVGAEIGSRPEVIKKKSDAMSSRWSDAESRAKWQTAFSKEGCKKKQSDSKVQAWADPVVGAKLRAIHSSDEVRRKKAEAKARNWADPTYRAMMSERIRAGHAKRRLNKGA